MNTGIVDRVSLVRMLFQCARYTCTCQKQVMIDARIPGWMSVGFSSDGDMIGSDAVVGFPGQDEVLEYELGSKVRGRLKDNPS